MDNLPNPNNLWLPYQLDWIRDTSKYAICEKSRRIGITFAEAFRAVHVRMMNIHLGTPRNYNYIAQTEKSSERFIEDVIKHAYLINSIAKYSHNKPIANLSKATKSCVPFVDGSVIQSFSSNPDAIRGSSGDVCIDEAAFAPDGESLEKAAFPIVSTIGQNCQLRIVSTHNGHSSWFNRLLTDAKSGKRPGWSHHRTDIYKAVNQGLALKHSGPHLSLMPDREKTDQAWISSTRSMYSDLTWQQEFECHPLSSGLTLVSHKDYDTLAKSENTNSYPSNDKKYGNLFVGSDFGINDLTAIWVLEERYNAKVLDENLRREFFARHVINLKGVRPPEQQEICIKIMSHPNVVSGYFDHGTFGLTIVDHLAKTTGKAKGVSFNNPMKKQMAELVRKYVSQQRILLPAGRNDVKDDVCCAQMIISDTGAVTYGGRSSVGHCDNFWALGLALLAAEENQPLYAKGLIR